MNFGNQCLEGHKEHDTLVVSLFLYGEHYGLPDAPPIPKRLATKISLEVFEWKQYANSPRYCPADDAFSVSIFRNGVWEAFETSLFLDILDRGDKNNHVLDFGSQLGWYSILAGLKGYNVIAYDFCKEIIDLFWRNVKRNSLKNKIRLVRGFINKDGGKIPFDNKKFKEIEFLKADVEGAEQHVYRITKHLFKEKRIKYALLEISPCFNDSYPDLVLDIISNGYTAYQVPGKGMSYFNEFAEQPLATLKKYCALPTDKEELTNHINSLRQENFLLIRNDLI